LPPPGGGLVGTTNRIANVAKATGVATSIATAGTILTQPNSPALPKEMSFEQLAEAGKVEDRGGLTRAGRGLQKHGGRPGSVFPNPSGSVSQINTQGQEVLEDILNNPNNEIIETQGGSTKVYDPNGRGAHFDKNGSFIGFIERQYE
ncbi:MAG: hypothetical protein KDK64_06720, partial [Chlamydiia bacterium]|nr:hypothetical protein [Chlamydiia bacterium]